MADFNNIELRSEKVRNIIGKVPPEIIRTGIGDITVILLILYWRHSLFLILKISRPQPP